MAPGLRWDAAVFVLVWAATAPAQVLNGHPVVLDPDGGLLPWIAPSGDAYAGVVRLGWERLEAFPDHPGTGLPGYFTHATFDPDTLFGTALFPHHPAGVFAMFTDSAVAWFPYSGDAAAIGVARRAIDHLMSRGITAPTDDWASVPYACSNSLDLDYRGADDSGCGGCGIGDGTGVVEPDKMAEVGVALVQLYMHTGVVGYRDAALHIANELLRHRRPGTLTRSPWPFRAYAATGAVKEDYTASLAGPLRLFDLLIRLGVGDTAALTSARQAALDWLIQYPVANERWAAYFEDVAVGASSINNLAPAEAARYLLEHPEQDPQWQAHATAMLDFVVREFGQDNVFGEPGLQYGARAISEQDVDMYKMGSHTARFGSVTALLAARTGDAALLDRGFRSLNWATYLCRANGVVNVGVDGREGYWFSDSYGDYLRHFMAAMVAVPAWAPAGESHLLGSSSVVQTVAYPADAIRYTVFEPDAVETLRLAAPPLAITAGGTPLAQRTALDADGYTVEPLGTGSDVAVRIRHTTASSVEVLLGTPEVTDAGADAGADAGPDGGGPKSCGCQTGGGALTFALLTVLAAMVASRQTRRSR